MLPKIAVLSILALCGCDPSPSTISVSDMDLPRGKVEFGGDSLAGRPGIDFGSIRFEGKRVIVWSDGAEKHPEYSGGMVKGQIQSRRSGPVVCSYEVPVSGTGIATIDGKQYKMANGNLFLVSLNGASILVRQLQRDLPGVELELNADNGAALKQAMRDDIDFKQFFRHPGTVIDEDK